MAQPPAEPWYKDGLKFKCTGCGECCTGGPGAVWITEEEAEAIADHLEMELQDFADQYLRRINGRLSLKEKSDSYDCVFLKDRACTIYHLRPEQCRTFPWWPENLRDPDAWEAAARTCEGIDHSDAPTVPYEKIKESL